MPACRDLQEAHESLRDIFSIFVRIQAPIVIDERQGHAV